MSRLSSIDPTSFLSPLAGCLKPGSTILDVGCGSGRDMRWFKERGFVPTGFERSWGLAALARKHSECPVLEGDYECYDFSATTADALVLVGALVSMPHVRFESVFRNISVGAQTRRPCPDHPEGRPDRERKTAAEQIISYSKAAELLNQSLSGFEKEMSIVS